MVIFIIANGRGTHTPDIAIAAIFSPAGAHRLARRDWYGFRSRESQALVGHAR
jgi:hypothetical protein